MKDIKTYIKEVYEKAKTMPEMDVIKMDSEEIDFDPEFEVLLKQALLEYINSESVDLENYPEVQFSKKHERKMKKIFKLARKIDARNYRTKHWEIRKKSPRKKD